ncbi:hypothetical protein [Bacillus thuringiensis]|uniref:hypothetical protein n=1 Tax=Bacillus thuringiensis TaxID=1428 RepID=UPI000B451A08|nr:hypothetical protein [Bacillus thuringiensis]MED3182866.1 hypothetical protein [Bacillus thuringiensis]OTY06059.1 hypothetical protein BK734_21400 [Bacillus thuringiensis serovar kim]OUB13752.1 hypothetical protein BK733_26740 [Bacillus thuringiensis serovar xiaguangiensis]PGV02328.1 hypothetical protein COD69_02560 [Bacillus thuringiensis]
MAQLSRKLSTGDTMVFDAEKHSLYIVPSTIASQYMQINVTDAEKLVAAGKAKQFSKGELQKVQEALSAVVLLTAL